MSTDYQIREAEREDYQRLAELLEKNRQSIQDILVSGTKYWIAEDIAGQPIGTIGVEIGRDSMLLRSAAVLIPWRKQGIGKALVNRALDAGTKNGFKKAYLFSRTAGKYWMRFGFYEVSVAEVVDALPEVPQVKHYLETGTIWTDIAWRCDLITKTS